MSAGNPTQPATSAEAAPPPPAALIPVKPKGLRSEDETRLQETALQLAGEVHKDAGNRQVARRLSALGVREQQKASKEIGLLKMRVGTMLGQLEGEGAEIPKTLIELRHTMDEINPNVLSQPSGIAKWVGKAPGVGKILKRIAVKYESVQTQIDHIMNGLASRQGQVTARQR